MAPVISLIVIFALSMLITKIASEALIHTGLSKQAARFQARSAFSGVGFTTTEAESIVNHPVRRKIVMALMLIGNVGIISAIASLMLTFVNTSGGSMPVILRIGIILASLFLLWMLSRSKIAESFLEKLITKALKKFTMLDVKDYVELLNLRKDYGITVITVDKEDWMESKLVKEIKLRQEGINLIGVQRGNGTYIGTPNGETKIVDEDRLILYGRRKNLRNLEQRTRDYRGDLEHEKAMKEQEEEVQKEEKRDKITKEKN